MKKSSVRALIPLGVFLILAALLFYGLQLDPRKVPSPLVGKPAPEFQLESLKQPGQQLDRSVLLGKVSLVNIWASWCPSCRQEHGELMRIARESDVQIIGYNWKDEREAGLLMLRQYGDPYDLTLFDPNNEAGIDWGIYGAPETFVVDPEGIIRHKQIGPVTREVWDQEIRPLVERYQARS